ncbi:MAG TPA: FAD-dependent oxidoreductase [Candidatus Acidoferrales bacterium]|nr:FAD-dependent oxidoreductase [Candidatus Acidoferrales bacterium]
MSQKQTYDIAVVGAGVFGAWTAYQLARAGAKTLLVDAYGAGNSRASSSGETRIIRMGYGADEIYTRYSMRAQQLWQKFCEDISTRLFLRTGVLWLAREGDPIATQTLATLAKVGVPHKKLLHAEIEKRYPQISCADIDSAIYEPESGILMARRAVQKVTEAFQTAGGTFQIAEVEAPKGKGRLDSISTWSGEALSAGSYVFACGPWLPKVFPDVLGSRIFPTRQEIYFFGVPAGDRSYSSGNFPAWLDQKNLLYGIPDVEGRGFKIASDQHGSAVDPDKLNRIAGETLEQVRNYLRLRFPGLRDAPVIETRVCQYENSSSGDFLIDRHPELQNVWLVGGGSGHGFKHGPAVGEHVAKLLLDDAEIEPRFSLASKQTMQARAVY